MMMSAHTINERGRARAIAIARARARESERARDNLTSCNVARGSTIVCVQEFWHIDQKRQLDCRIATFGKLQDDRPGTIVVLFGSFLAEGSHHLLERCPGVQLVIKGRERELESRRGACFASLSEVQDDLVQFNEAHCAGCSCSRLIDWRDGNAVVQKDEDVAEIRAVQHRV